MNLRPPGPELLLRRFHLVRRLSTASQALEIRKGDRRARLLNPGGATACEARFVAPVSPATSRRPVNCRANHFFRSRKSQRNWPSAEQPRTAFARAVSFPISVFRTPSASRRRCWRSTWLRGPISDLDHGAEVSRYRSFATIAHFFASCSQDGMGSFTDTAVPSRNSATWRNGFSRSLLSKTRTWGSL